MWQCDTKPMPVCSASDAHIKADRFFTRSCLQAKHECELVWEAMQTELHQLFAELLDAPALTAHHGPAAPSGA